MTTRWRRDIAFFLAGLSATMFGSMLVSFAVLWHLTLRTQSGSILTAVAVFATMPYALVSLVGGSLADRYDRKRLLIGANLATAVATLALALLFRDEVQGLWMFYLTLAVRSALQGVLAPAAEAAIPGIVPDEHLLRVNGINQTIASTALLIAPLFASAVYANLGLVPILFVDVAASLVAAVLLVPLPRLCARTEDGAGSEDWHAWGDLVAGLRYVARHRTVRWLVAIYAVALTMIAAPSSLTPLMMARTFGPDVWRLTANEMFWAAGELLAGLGMAWLGTRLRGYLRVIVLALFATGVLTVAVGLAPNMWVFLVLLFAVAAAFTTISVPEFTLVQQEVEPAMMGRVFGLLGIISSIAMSAGMLILGPLADRLSVESLLVASGLALVAIMALLVGRPGLRRLLVAPEQ